MSVARTILYVSHTPALKGSAVSLVQLVLGLDASRFRPCVAFSKPGFLVDDLSARGLSCTVLNERGFWGWRLVRQARSLMERERVGLVHLNSAVPFCKYVGIAARSLGLKVVWHIREDPRGKRIRRLRKWIRHLAHKVIVVSSELEDAFETFPVVKIFNGVDMGRFHPGIDRTPFRDRFGIPHDAFLFGIVGTIEERKGTLLFLHAADALLKSGRDAFFSIVGDGALEDERAVRQYLAERPTLASRVILTGRLDDIPQVMAGIDVLVMPSLWEGFPRSLIEAMASGRAAIASGVGEIPFILEDGVCGRVVPKGDRAALSRAMEEFVCRRGDLAEMGMRGRQRVLEQFTLEKHVRTVMNEYEKLLGQNGPGSGPDGVKGVRK